MLLNNRPYTNENGWEDKGLITDLSIEDQVQVFDWIKKHIEPSVKVNHNYTSYSLKHGLENMTKIYLTNNQFKDAMWLSGYRPVNKNELNWEYRIKLIKHTEA